MAGNQAKITQKGLEHAESRVTMLGFICSALGKHFSDLKYPELVVPENRDKIKSSTIIKALEMMLDEMEFDLEAMQASVPEPSTPPSLGTVVRCLRESGEVYLNDVQPEDRLLTEKLTRLPHDDAKMCKEGAKAAKRGLRPEDNPYDIMDDQQALNFLSWSDGYQSVEPKAGFKPVGLIAIPRAKTDAMVKTIVQCQIEQMSEEGQVLVLKPFLPGSDLVGCYALCHFEPTDDSETMVTAPYCFEEIGPIPNTVIQSMGSQGYLSIWDGLDLNNRTWSVSFKAIKEIGSQLGYEVVPGEDDGPGFGR